MPFLVTDQMVEVWKELASNSSSSIKRVLAGPIMGVGKSYLAYFLVSKAYSEGWLLLLYVSDTNNLVCETSYDIPLEICARILAINKDILTVNDFELDISLMTKM
ncbi:uncharacterized protein OCT59_004923 [Rhizophagus irregularis]|uniref:Uncharacterized protein n=1 Tax=Rhizophagus irregularis (strain DAOM 197198w) TaxID=1432141 RepID=A0A015L8A2_RHIIW|nr:hypothetical protein RirG_037620 [Rhizophagus irregularis DAOM 197198w]UZO13424.1 hypothetical protein OCT59_004923 [Rhizophagus irregularis]GBC21664.1 hypothetical protein GLOIN_2v1482214 [Rhizophagus irregularis DAOM 181602=DAOM 197198]CAG8605480.1 16640_t:CDS:1 [Rhizophagus irregularis]